MTLNWNGILIQYYWMCISLYAYFHKSKGFLFSLQNALFKRINLLTHGKCLGCWLISSSSPICHVHESIRASNMLIVFILTHSLAYTHYLFGIWLVVKIDVIFCCCCLSYCSTFFSRLFFVCCIVAHLSFSIEHFK